MKIIQLLQAHDNEAWQGMLLGLGDDGIVYEQGISGWNPVIFPNKATENLIAAAPQMLDALEMADELIDQLIIDNTDTYVEERAKIRAAIAAAKGEV